MVHATVCVCRVCVVCVCVVCVVCADRACDVPVYVRRVGACVPCVCESCVRRVGGPCVCMCVRVGGSLQYWHY